MPFYEDLSPCVYQRREQSDVPAVNVGWLDVTAAFPVGASPPGFAERLARLAYRYPVNRMRGWEQCRLCDGEYPIQIEVDDERHPVGDAETRVPALDGRIYAAPTLIAHYVTTHG